MEIERKFLVKAEPDLGDATSVAVRQGYITRPGDSVSVRLRQKGAKFLLTVKSGEGLVREEHETRIEHGIFETFWPATEGRRVEKTRWTGALPKGETFEYDVFEGYHSPLRLVEVEFESRKAAEAFIPPDWFGTEVTGERAYSNEVLATEGLPSETAR
ncbi:CYTH domain-containing protein [Roseivivax halotolerans]|uniref:CYTH domain-containing protein n=1 Tax=Roseivivax halotolerans TaxID=93684 RepID=A0A1I6AA36_9RHOB|nr:CYTH domain-containing protein [Roseivivax halotolerans]SFQ65525.1 CYTH domain-containing protein [Roseivivax halotolerans]